ncbi:MAG: hypothetical protein FD169_2215 [Bacillota bacterium]|nr:MAG: hypothetical protein FD169_2215 [Bacillota bacterium]MBS3950532.1 GatB/YqeY domain-containing protein [Peptococcaceae bacterium]
MEIKKRLEEDIKTAMRAKDAARLSTLRLVKAAIKNAEVAKLAELIDDEVIIILSREIKQRKETIPDFARGKRPDLVEKSEQEIAYISAYLPVPLSTEELEAIIAAAIKEVSATGLKDQGKVMGIVSPRVKGRADGKEVSQRVRTLLEGLSGA